MNSVKYLRELGYASDILNIPTLYHNKSLWNDFANPDRAVEDINYFENILLEFPRCADDLKMFFYKKEGNKAFLPKYYFDEYLVEYYEIYSFDFFCNEILKTDKFIENVIKYYFNINSDEVLREYLDLLKTNSREFTVRIDNLNIPEEVKKVLVMFILDPIYYIEKLINELKKIEVSMDEFYKKHYEDLIDMCNNINFNELAEAINKLFNGDAKIENMPARAYSCCLVNRNIIRWIAHNSESIYIFGQYGVSMAEAYARRIIKIDVERFGKILSDTNRVEIIKLLEKEKELFTSEIAKKINLSVTTTYYHLEMMKETGMLHARVDGRAVFFRINHEYYKNAIKALNILFFGK